MVRAIDAVTEQLVLAHLLQRRYYGVSRRLAGNLMRLSRPVRNHADTMKPELNPAIQAGGHSPDPLQREDFIWHPTLAYDDRHGPRLTQASFA
jgi:hypothetical protein